MATEGLSDATIDGSEGEPSLILLRAAQNVGVEIQTPSNMTVSEKREKIRANIQFLSKRGFTDMRIADELKVSVKTVRKWKNRDGIRDKSRPGRTPVLMSSPTKATITNICKDEWNASTRKVAKVLNGSEDYTQREKTVSEATVRRYIRSTDWGRFSYKATVKPMLSERNITDRTNFSAMVMEKGYTQRSPEGDHLLEHLLFTDESTIELYPRPNKQNTRIRTSNPNLRSPVQIPKHGLKIMIAGGLAARGLTELHICGPQTTINGQYYREKIIPVYLREVSNPEVDNPFAPPRLFESPRNVVFMQDGAPAHSANETLELLRQYFSTVWGKGTWPGNSPDLNPIEHMCDTIQKSVFDEPRPRNRNELISRVQDTWRSFSSEQTMSLVYSFGSRIRQCNDRRGQHTDY